MIDFLLNLRDSNEDHAWATASVWLSLDQFGRFWPDVGLALENGEAVKSAVKSMRSRTGSKRPNKSPCRTGM